MRHRSLLPLLFALFAVLASFAHAAAEAGVVGEHQHGPRTGQIHVAPLQAMEHSGAPHAHQHGAGEHSHAGTQVAIAPSGRDGRTGQVWLVSAFAGRLFALYDPLERPPRT